MFPAGDIGNVDVGGRVGLSRENGLEKGCSGGPKFPDRRSGEEYFVAKGEAVGGRGLRLTEEVEDCEVTVSARVLVDKDGPRGRSLFSACSFECSTGCSGELLDG